MRILVLMVILLLPFKAVAGHAHDTFLEVVKHTRQAIVVVQTKLNDPVIISGNPLQEYMKSKEPKKKERLYDAFGTGFVVQGNYIITNNHVIDNYKQVTITFEDDPKIYEVEVIASDSMTDIAVLKMKDPERLKDVIPLVWSLHGVEPGESVWAIGHPLGLNYTVSKGIVSHVKRRASNGWQGFIQTDVSINHGNSGGPLLNMDGEVVGVNTLIMAPGKNAGSVGLSMSVDSKIAARTISLLLSDGEVKRPYMGFTMKFNADKRRVKVDKIIPESPSARYGVHEGDFIMQMNGMDIISIDEVFDFLLDKSPNDRIKILISRENKPVIIDMVLGRLNEAELNIQLHMLVPPDK